MGMTGQARALCLSARGRDRLAIRGDRAASRPSRSTGKPPASPWRPPTPRTANRPRLPLPSDLAADLAAYVATLRPGEADLPSAGDKGAKMLRVDLEAAGIPYRDASGLVFDFHSLRCELATLADAAGVSPRVVQRTHAAFDALS